MVLSFPISLENNRLPGWRKSAHISVWGRNHRGSNDCMEQCLIPLDAVIASQSHSTLPLPHFQQYFIFLSSEAFRDSVERIDPLKFYYFLLKAF